MSNLWNKQHIQSLAFLISVMKIHLVHLKGVVCYLFGKSLSINWYAKACWMFILNKISILSTVSCMEIKTFLYYSLILTRFKKGMFCFLFVFVLFFVCLFLFCFCLFVLFCFCFFVHLITPRCCFSWYDIAMLFQSITNTHTKIIINSIKFV